VKIYVTVVEVLRKKERQDETQCKYQPKLVEKLVWVPVIKKERQDETQCRYQPKLVEKLVWVPVISFKKEGGKKQ
jgi:hypothetical protein